MPFVELWTCYHHCPRATIKSIDRIAHASQEVSDHLHALHGAEPMDVIDATVTVDGTWSKRGLTAMHGGFVVISWETGEV